MLRKRKYLCKSLSTFSVWRFRDHFVKVWASPAAKDGHKTLQNSCTEAKIWIFSRVLTSSKKYSPKESIFLWALTWSSKWKWDALNLLELDWTKKSNKSNRPFSLSITYQWNLFPSLLWGVKIWRCTDFYCCTVGFLLHCFAGCFVHWSPALLSFCDTLSLRLRGCERVMR